MINEADFLQYLDTQIQLEMKLSATSDGKRLTGLRNIKSDYTYAKNQKNAKTFDVIIKSMYKSRIETAELYRDTNQDLFIQESIESELLKPFLPKEIDETELFEFFKTLPITKEKLNFKRFQEAAKEKYGVTVDSKIILKYITEG